jgi:formylglycine-generating enzyme required for sulfatase activity
VRNPNTGRWEIEPETGIVLVLLAGGNVTIGSKRIVIRGSDQKPENWAQAYAIARQSEDYGAPYFDAGRDSDERMVEGVALDPFFFSKYETTQSQWSRLLDANPSQHFDEASLGGPTHPVETFSWRLSRTAAERLALTLPTEAQWEYACRAGTTTPFSSGEEFDSLTGFANIADATFHASGVPESFTEEVVDGWICHAPVSSFEPNAFGLFNMHGNVWEWCVDAFASLAPPHAGDGSKEIAPNAAEGVIRGGSFSAEARNARSANRFSYDRNNTDSDVGVRFARKIDR